MTCPTCGDRLDAVARCAGSDTCSACAWHDGDMDDLRIPDDVRDVA